MHNYTYHIDAGHGWLEVPLIDILRCGLAPWDFSEYSYYRNTDRTFYLEEDSDMNKFLYAYHDIYDFYPAITEKHYKGECVVRCYAHNPMPYPRRAA